MKINKYYYLSVLTIIFLLPLLGQNVFADTVLNKDWERNEIVWMTGYEFDVTDFNPWSGAPNFGLALMYETLFTYDMFTDKYIDIIGTDFSWNEDGSELLVNITDKAVWSDGEPLDIDDVIYSYILASNQTRFRADMTKRISGFTKESDYAMTINIVPGFNFSLKVVEFISAEIPIVPEHVWKWIVAIENGGNTDLEGFLFNWHNPLFNTSWMVCSGPYMPYYQLDPAEEVMIYRDDWWGAGIVDADLPSRMAGKSPPKYVGARHYSDNNVKVAALIAEAVDCSSGFVPEIWTIMDTHPEISTWFGRQNAQGINGNYFLGLGSVLSIAPNNEKPPLNETYVREAMAYSLNNDPIPDIAAYGYWDKAEPSFLPSISPYYNKTIADTYRREHNIAKAREILENANCTLEPDGLGGYHWVTPYGTAIDEFHLITVTGWGDVLTASELWAASMADLNITVYVDQQIQQTFESNVGAGNYEMCMQTRTPHLINPALTFFDGYRGVNKYDKNVSRWNSPEYNAAFENFELSGSNPAEAQYWASQMQLLLATEIPEIPCFNNAFWYSFSTKYWEGWNIAENQFEQPVTVFINNNIGLKARWILNLYSTGAGSAEFPWLIVGGIIAGVSIAGVVVVIGIVRFRRRKV